MHSPTLSGQNQHANEVRVNLLPSILAGKEEQTEFEDAKCPGIVNGALASGWHSSQTVASSLKSPWIQSPLKITPAEASMPAIQVRLCQFCIE